MCFGRVALEGGLVGVGILLGDYFQNIGNKINFTIRIDRNLPARLFSD